MHSLTNSWLLSGSHGKNIPNDESTRVSDSDQRFDQMLLNTLSRVILDTLYMKAWYSKKDLHYRFCRYSRNDSGIGGEVLYQPYQSRVAYGLSANWVQQRDYDKSLST